MALNIVWRNPLRPRSVERKIKRIGSHQFGSVYAVTNVDVRHEFELLLSQILSFPCQREENDGQLLSQHKSWTMSHCFAQAPGIFCGCFGLIRRRS